MDMLDVHVPCSAISRSTARLIIEVTAQLTALQGVLSVLQVEEWEVKNASAYPTTIVDSSTAKRRKVYFGCRDAYNDPQVLGSVPVKHMLFVFFCNIHA